MRRLRMVGGLLVLLALGTVAAGCGGAIPSSSGSKNASVELKASKLGSVITDGQGHTLYLFERDDRGESYCNGACASVWPPYETDGTPQASGGLPASGLGTIKRDNGDLQVTYKGHPLYFYAGDASRPGRMKGEGLDQFGAEWYAVGRNGKSVEESKSGGSKMNNSGGGYG
jgi:predicted lipoprotein with Yx(FWY)xxD motif